MKTTLLKTLLAGAAVTGIAVGGAQAQDRMAGQNDALTGFKDGANITISGTVRVLEEDEFMLDIDGQEVEVELDEWDWMAGETNLGSYLNEGDKVVVSGTVDDDWFEAREIEANNIYLAQDLAYYYVVDTNPAYYSPFVNDRTMRDGTYVSARGTVENVSEGGFTLSSQGNEITVDTGDLSYAPGGKDQSAGQNQAQDQMKQNAAQNKPLDIKQGDRVFVFGEMDSGFFEQRELEADAVVKITRVDQREQNQGAGQNQTGQDKQPNRRDL